MTLRKQAILISLLYAGAPCSPAISDSSLDAQSVIAKTNASVPSTSGEFTSTVANVAIPPSSAGASVAPYSFKANPLWAMPLNQFSATRDRPIFLPSRRPPAPPASTVTVVKVVGPPKPQEPEQPELSLVGTISGGDDKLAIFIDKSTKAVLRLRLGEDFQGWTLKSVQGREAALQKNS